MKNDLHETFIIYCQSVKGQLGLRFLCLFQLFPSIYCMINLVRNARIIMSILYKLIALENSWEAQWLGLQASTAGSLGSIPDLMAWPKI